MIGHRVEIDIGEIDALFRTIENAFASEIAVQVHLAEADGMAFVIATGNRRDGADMAHVCNSRQCTDRGFNRLAKIWAIHGCCNIERAEVAGNILAEMLIRQIII
ncbi:hypothetical protein D9M69_591260 [compost metagenome]